MSFQALFCHDFRFVFKQESREFWAANVTMMFLDIPGNIDWRYSINERSSV